MTADPFIIIWVSRFLDKSKMLELMEKIQDIEAHRRKMNQASQGLNEAKGYTTGVIKGMEQEIAIIQKNSIALEDNVSKIEAEIVAKKEELSGLSEGTDEYKKAAEDLQSLQEAHQNYSEELLQNKIDIVELEKNIKEAYASIRQQEIDLRNLILQAIEDREEKEERMLQGTIDVENEIMDILTARYEKERDEILETSQAKIDAMEQEIDLIDQQLEARKKANDEEDKALKLKELENKLSRISSDPTRKKEQLSIIEQISSLREEMAWDLAEKEAEAQKESIEEQITSVEDYMEYVESYYEDLFNNPRKLIEEMSELMKKTDDEIIAWLKENSKEFSMSTDATQTDMINSWKAMLDDMHGSVVTHWDEVDQIIAQGDDAIIQFLMDHSADYAEAGKLQAEAYVDEWKEQLDNLRNAYKAIAEEISSYSYDIVTPGTGGDSKSGSGGGSGSKKKKYQATYPTIGDVEGGTLKPFNSEQDAYNAATEKIRQICRQVSGSSSGMIGQWAQSLYQKISVSAYKQGGLASETGLAWIDGSKTRPERILSPQQTEDFEELLETLRAIKTIRAPLIPSIDTGISRNDHGLNIEGDIVVNVESLTSEQDYEIMAMKVKESLYKEMSRGSIVGGIRVSK